MPIKNAVELYQLIGGIFLSQLFVMKYSYSELYIIIANILMKKKLFQVKHEFIRFILDDLIYATLIKKSFWTGKYELTFVGRQKVIDDTLSNKEELKV